MHGISTEFALANGTELGPVLDEFAADLDDSAVVVAHNVDFDANVMGAEFLRAGMPNQFDRLTKRCTMKESTEFCRIPGNYGHKWPSLSELHQILFDAPISGAHDAMVDCDACMRSFFRLVEHGVM